MLIYHVALNIKISIFYYYFSSNEKSKIIPDIFLYYKIFMNACIYGSRIVPGKKYIFYLAAAT